MTFLHTRIDHAPTAETAEWMKQETAEQEVRYSTIEKAMADLAPTREQWYNEFFYRITKKGFSEDGDRRRKIKPEDLPVKPEGRVDTVIWKYGELSIAEVEGK